MELPWVTNSSVCAGIPSHFQNWGDPVSEILVKPEVKLPEDFDSLDQTEQESIRETIGN